MKKKQIRMREMELYTLGAMDEGNAKDLQSLLESYRRLVFPGTAEKKSKEDEQFEAAKRALAEEAKKVLLIKPIDKDALFKRARRAETSGKVEGNQVYNQIAGKALVEHERERMQLLHRQQRAEKASDLKKELRERARKGVRKPVGKRGKKR